MTTLTITAASSSSSTVPTVAGTDIATPVRLMVGDTDSSNYEFSDSDLTYLAARAVTYYQRLRPYTKTYDVTTVAGQQDYAVPTDCIRVTDVPYRVFGGLTSTTYLAYYNYLYAYPMLVPFADWSDETLNRIRQEFTLRFDAVGAGQSEIVDYLTSYASTQYVRVYPTPSASGTVFTIRYQANHPLQANNYFTIPPQHAIWIQKLLEAEVYEARAAKIGSTATQLGAGTTKMDFTKAMEFNYRKANACRQEVLDALGYIVGKVG